MKIRNNLRLRFILSFTLFTMLISGLFALIIHFTERKLADEFFNRRINAELNHFAERYKQDPAVSLPSAEDIRSYLGTKQMLNQIARIVEKVPDGYHERELDRYVSVNLDDSLNWKFYTSLPDRQKFKKWKTRELDYLVFGIKTLHDKQRIYIFIDLWFWYQKERELRAHSMWVYGLAAILAICLGFITANRIINPLNRLMDVVKNSDPDNMPSGFSQAFGKDEFGTLARAFEDSFKRIKSFIKREHQFTRDASHELRTPVTVIKGAVELLKMTSACEEKMVDKLVRRIDKSTMDMESTIESLLWLARESNKDDPGQPSNLVPIVQRAIEQNRHLIEGKPIEFDLKVESNPVVTAPTGVLSIAVTNLIRNACQFTSRGKISVALRQDRIVVTDTGVGIETEILEDIIKPDVTSAESSGFGFGLDIVNRLCTKFGWRMKIESTPDQGTEASLIFPQK